jgi:hypothetical protein
MWLAGLDTSQGEGATIVVEQVEGFGRSTRGVQIMVSIGIRSSSLVV